MGAMRRRALQTLAAALGCLAYASSAFGDLGAFARVPACEMVAEAFCRAYDDCARSCPTCDDPRGKTCRAVERAFCSRRGQASPRPARATVSGDDADRCHRFAVASSKSRLACVALTNDVPRQECSDFYAEAVGDDYAPVSPVCGPEHHLEGGMCLLTCSSDADCRPGFETCIARACVARRRTP